MTSKPTNYYRPATRDEALALVGEPDAIAVAGGALLFSRLELPYTTVIDLQDVPELNEIAADEHGVTIGAAVRLQDVVESDDVPAFLKRSLTRALPLNIRNGASVGESLMLDQPPREWLAAPAPPQPGVWALRGAGRRAPDGTAGRVAVHRRIRSARGCSPGFLSRRLGRVRRMVQPTFHARPRTKPSSTPLSTSS